MPTDPSRHHAARARLRIRAARAHAGLLAAAVGFVTAGATSQAHAAQSAKLPMLDLGWSGLEAGRSCMSGLRGALEIDLGLFTDVGQSSAPCGGLQGVGFAVLALVALVTIALGRMRLQTESKRLDLAQRLVEQGIDPPPGLLMGPARNDLRKGIVLGFAGVGLFVSGLMLGDRGLAAGACVPAFIGVGYLLSFVLASRVRGGDGGG